MMFVDRTKKSQRQADIEERGAEVALRVRNFVTDLIREKITQGWGVPEFVYGLGAAFVLLAQDTDYDPQLVLTSIADVRAE